MTDTRLCERCGKMFARRDGMRPSVWNKRKFCSMSCSKDKGRRKPEPYRVDPEEIMKLARASAKKSGAPRSDFDDMTQEAAIVGYQSLWYFDDSIGMNVFAWMKWTMDKELRKRIGRARSRMSPFLLGDEEEDSEVQIADYRESDPVSAADTNELLAVMARIQDGWPQDRRDVFRSRQYEGESIYSLSKRMKIRKAAVNCMLAECMDELRDEMARITA